MSDDPTPTGQTQPTQDEAYWASLFEQEELIAPPPSLDADEATTAARWSPLDQRLDGRFRWADGGKPQEDGRWQLAREAFERDELLELSVIGYNKGGVLVSWNDLQGFVPASQLNDMPHLHLREARLRELKRRQHQSIRVKIIEVDEANNRFILSERATQFAAEDRRTVLLQTKPGARLKGTITNLTDFGAFVDLGGVEGLIHISELSWRRVVHPSDIVTPGQTLDIVVLNVDEDAGRVGLSLKQLKADPWQTVDERYEVGQLVEGIVSNVASFGAFVMIEDELEGLIHISELAEGSFMHPRNVIQKGDRVKARVLKVNGAARRLALTLRGAGA